MTSNKIIGEPKDALYFEGRQRVGVLADYESRSECDLLSCGSSVYSRHPSTQVLMLAAADVYFDPDTERFVVDFGSKRLWRFDRPSQGIKEYLPKKGELLFAHNAQFEYDITVNTLGLPLEIEQLYCTAFMALYNGLPKRLDDTSKALPLVTPKDMEGNRLMKKVCKPNADGVFELSPEQMERLCVYGLGDIDSEGELLEKLRPVPDLELSCYHETAKINTFGLPVDRELIESASKIVTEASADIAKKFPDVNMRSHAQIKKYTEKYGFTMKSTDKEHVTKYLALPDLPPEVRELLQAKDLGIGSSSVSKFDSLLNYIDLDDMLRNAYIHHGAMRSGRWTSVGAQIQNLPKGEKYIIEPDKAGVWLLPIARELIRNNDYDGLYMITNGRPMDALKSVIRSVFAPGDGLKFVQRDLSAIEARGVLWVSKARGLSVFTDFDAGVGVEPYMIFANKIKSDRFMGKQGILSCVAEGTPVLTDSGWVPIEQVSAHHKVFDGQEFVPCEGAIDKGKKPITCDHWLPITLDHKVQHETGWETCENLNYQTLSSALSMASGDLAALSLALEEESSMCKVSAPVASPPDQSTLGILYQKNQLDAMHVPREKLTKPNRFTHISSLIKRLEECGLSGSPLSILDATTQTAKITTGTGGE